MSKVKTILAVDDDSDILKILQRILQGAGFEVLLAQSPEEARKLLSERIPHLILTDLNMSPESGQSFISHLRKQKKYDDIPVIVLSAVNEFNSVKSVLGLGVTDYVIKPLNPSMLLRKIKKALLHLDFVRLDLSHNDSKKISVKLPAKITSLGESRFQIKGPFKLASGSKIRITSEELSRNGLSLGKYEVSKRLKTYEKGGSFFNDINFTSLTKAEAENIKKFIKKKNV